LRADYFSTCRENNSALSLACPAQEFPEEQLNVSKDDFVAPCCLFIVTSHSAYMQYLLHSRRQLAHIWRSSVNKRPFRSCSTVNFNKFLCLKPGYFNVIRISLQNF